MTVMGASAISGMTGIAILGLLVISIWSLIWKGFALWHSAKNKQKGWFIAVLILNTMGLLPIIYLLWFKPKCEECTVKIEPVKKTTKKRKSKS